MIMHRWRFATGKTYFCPSKKKARRYGPFRLRTYHLIGPRKYPEIHFHRATLAVINLHFALLLQMPFKPIFNAFEQQLNFIKQPFERSRPNS
jgi:hypothetical protein